MEIKKIINSSQGRIVMSILLGLGLATLFKRACKGNNCVIFEKAADEDVAFSLDCSGASLTVQ